VEEAMNQANHQNGEKALPIRAVVLDFGEVLCFLPEAAAKDRMARLFGIAPERFFEHYIGTRGPYDQGLLTAEEYWLGFAQGAGVKIGPDMVQLLRDWDTEMWSRINMAMAGWAEQLRAAGFTTALLSNMPHDMASYARKNFAWLSHFDHQILSCELQLIKPDPAVFQRAIERLGVRPEEALLVDDREPNVGAARAVGLRAIRFESVGQLRMDLMKMGFEVLPGSSS
jgi:putative hydrolase of the HAD superfamily